VSNKDNIQQLTSNNKS